MEEVKIGDQIWMTQNLDVDKFRNGDPIPEVKKAEEWKKADDEGKPAWCYYDNDPATGEEYGKLYNWHAVNDPRDLALVGWHVPSDDEWTTLTDHLGAKDVAGTKMKSTSGWEEDGNGTNESGFAGLPGGGRDDIGPFFSNGKFGYWWSSSEDNTSLAWARNLFYGLGGAFRLDFGKGLGFSVRCLRD